jgi:hypothetical protein
MLLRIHGWREADMLLLPYLMHHFTFSLLLLFPMELIASTLRMSQYLIKASNS